MTGNRRCWFAWIVAAAVAASVCGVAMAEGEGDGLEPWREDLRRMIRCDYEDEGLEEIAGMVASWPLTPGDRQDGELLLNVGRCLWLRNFYTELVELADRLEGEWGPEFRAPATLLRAQMMQSRGDEEGAMAAYRRVIALAAATADDAQQWGRVCRAPGEAHRALAEMLEERGEWEEALVSCPRSSLHNSPALAGPGCVGPPRNTPGMPSSARLARTADGSPTYATNFSDRTLGHWRAALTVDACAVPIIRWRPEEQQGIARCREMLGDLDGALEELRSFIAGEGHHGGFEVVLFYQFTEYAARAGRLREVQAELERWSPEDRREVEPAVRQAEAWEAADPVGVIEAWQPPDPDSVYPLLPPPAIIAGGRWLADMGRLAEAPLLRRIEQGDDTAAWLAAEARLEALRPAIEEQIRKQPKGARRDMWKWILWAMNRKEDSRGAW